MKNIERIAEELFDKIRSRFENVSLGDKETNETDDPTNARFFNFDYISESGENYGNITLSLIDEDALKIYFSKNLTDKLEDNEIEQEAWFTFLKGLRYFAKRNLMMFDTRDINRSNLTLRDLKSVAKSTSAYTTSDTPTSVTESALRGTSRTSTQDFGPVRLVIHHSDTIDENIPGARSRKIDSLFIETNLGERFRMPFKKLSAGRAMAEHVAHGGLVHDQAGQHIIGMVEEMSNLSFFVRNTRHRMFEDEETQSMVEAATERYQTLRSDLKRMSHPKGYQHFAEEFKPVQLETDDYDIEALKERFVKKFFDDRLTHALPYVQRAYSQKKTTEGDKYIKEFGNWASSVTESGEIDINGITQLMQKPIEAGLDGLDAINAIKGLVPDDDNLFSEIEELSQIAGTEVDVRSLLNSWLAGQGYPTVDIQPEEPIEPESTSPEKESPVTEFDLQQMRRLAGI
jgi:hypothetical protein